MNSPFTYMWQKQPYKTWKAPSTESAIPTWSKPYENGSVSANIDYIGPHGPDFKPRPLRQWRKQLQPYGGTKQSGASVGMPMDKPGGSVTQITKTKNQDDNNDKYCKSNPAKIKENVFKDSRHEIDLPKEKSVNKQKFLNRDKYSPQPGVNPGSRDVNNQGRVDRENPYVVCTECNPEANRIKSAIVRNDQDYCQNSSSYLQSRCKTFEQNLHGIKSVDSLYFYPNTGKIIYPNDRRDGPQERTAVNCVGKIKNYRENENNFTNSNNIDVKNIDKNLYKKSNDLYNSIANQSSAKRCQYRIIYKPNNMKFAKQGGTSSSARTKRLNYDTLTRNTAQFQNAAGAKSKNDGRFQFGAMSQYYIKSKFQKFVHHRKPGNHTGCFYTPTGSIGGRFPLLPAGNNEYLEADVAGGPCVSCLSIPVEETLNNGGVWWCCDDMLPVPKEGIPSDVIAKINEYTDGNCRRYSSFLEAEPSLGGCKRRVFSSEQCSATCNANYTKQSCGQQCSGDKDYSCGTKGEKEGQFCGACGWIGEWTGDQKQPTPENDNWFNTWIPDISKPGAYYCGACQGGGEIAITNAKTGPSNYRAGDPNSSIPGTKVENTCCWGPAGQDGRPGICPDCPGNATINGIFPGACNGP